MQNPASSQIVACTQCCLYMLAQADKLIEQVHVYGEQWRLQGDGYEAITFNKPK